MYFVFTAFWSYKFYYVYGFMLLVYSILSMVTVCTTIVSVYFVLNAENYHWQWIAFLSAGSTAGYVFLYSVFYFFYKTQMSGLLQVSFYFGYMWVNRVALCPIVPCISLLNNLRNVALSFNSIRNFYQLFKTNIIIPSWTFLLTLYHRILFCTALFFMCGTIGVWGASLFVKKIYRDVKIDWRTDLERKISFFHLHK